MVPTRVLLKLRFPVLRPDKHPKLSLADLERLVALLREDLGRHGFDVLPPEPGSETWRVVPRRPPEGQEVSSNPTGGLGGPKRST